MIRKLVFSQNRILNKFNIGLRMSTVSNTNEIEFIKNNKIGSIILNRPKQLNALNLPMVKQMNKFLDEFETDDNIHAIIIKGSGDKAFCAGGDVKTVREEFLKGDKQKGMQFFKEEYKLNYRIANLKKPYIALLNGVTMGGGVGLSVHGRFRVATEKTLFAMPETAIGFFGDVGGSYFLSRMKDSIGLYLILTGNRIKGQDNYRIGIATHYVPAKNLSRLEKELFEKDNLTVETVEEVLKKNSETCNDEFLTDQISRCFNEDDLEKILENLKIENSDWSKQQLKTLEKMSPTSLKVSIKQLQLGSKKNLKECLEMEYQLGQRFAVKSDFFEGVRALLIDKCNKPKWNPASVEKVDKNLVDWYFTPLDSDDKLF